EGLSLRAAVKIRHVHQRRRLLLDRTDQPGVRMTEQVDGDPGREVEVAGAVLGNQVAVLAADRPHTAPGVNGHQRGNRHGGFKSYGKRESANDEWRPPSMAFGRPPAVSVYGLGRARSNRRARLGTTIPSRVSPERAQG